MPADIEERTCHICDGTGKAWYPVEKHCCQTCGKVREHRNHETQCHECNTRGNHR